MNLAKSKDIICPKCKEVCQFEIKDYEINLFGCKNGHIEKNIKLNKFNDSQYIDLSKIICGICKKRTNLKLIIMNFLDVINAILIYVLYALQLTIKHIL